MERMVREPVRPIDNRPQVGNLPHIQLGGRSGGGMMPEPAFNEASLLGRNDPMPLHFTGGIAIFTQEISPGVQNVNLIFAATANAVVVGIDDVALLHLVSV